MTFGNLSAFGQDDPRRLLGWSTVSQVGYLLVPVAVAGSSALALPALAVYLAGYVVTNIAAFTVVAALPERRRLSDYRGLARVRPWLTASLVVSLLGLLGTPPTAVFVGKLAIATAAWDGGLAWLAVALLANSVLSLFYYLRWIAPLFASPEEKDSIPATHHWALASAIVAAAVSLFLGLVAGGLFALAS